MPKELTTGDLRRRNRARVLRALISEGESTRAELSRLLRLSLATVTNVVNDLTLEGLVHGPSLIPSDGGRPTGTLKARPEGAYFVGADVGEHGVTVELFDLSLRPVSRVFKNLPSRMAAPSDISRALSAAVDEVINLGGSPTNVFGIGLGVPGIVETELDPSGSDAASRIAIYAQSLNWPRTGLHDIYPRADFPVFADNGAKTLTAAESWFGAAKGIDNALVVLLGRGIGLGIINGGQILRGSESSAGEWGHTKVSLGGPQCNCGKRGCLEAYVGGGAIARRWSEAGGSPSMDEEKSLQDLLTAAQTGDAIAIGVVEETIEILGLGLSNMVNLFNPKLLVLGGWAGLQLAEYGLIQISEATRRHSLDRPAGQFELVSAKLGHDAVALGAALLAIENFIQIPLPETKQLTPAKELT